jgi:5'-3' exonuclease
MVTMIVDGDSLFARSWFAAQQIADDPAEAIRLAVNTILLILNPDTNKIGRQFTHILFAWDQKTNPLKKRTEPKPPKYYETKELVKDVFTFLLNAGHYDHPEFESDDIVATAAFNTDPKAEKYVVSADKDLHQIELPNCRYYCLHTKAVLSTKFILNKWHVKRISQVALALAIIGDPVDSIKGIHGWGPVKCKELFEAVRPEMHFAEALETIVEQIEDQDKLEQFYESLDRTLLKNNVPGVPESSEINLVEPVNVKAAGIQGIDYYYNHVFNAYTREPF